jgi:hypothetical protein
VKSCEAADQTGAGAAHVDRVINPGYVGDEKT